MLPKTWRYFDDARQWNRYLSSLGVSGTIINDPVAYPMMATVVAVSGQRQAIEGFFLYPEDDGPERLEELLRQGKINQRNRPDGSSGRGNRGGEKETGENPTPQNPGSPGGEGD